MKEYRRQGKNRTSATKEYKMPIWLKEVLKDLRSQYTTKSVAWAK
jgi:hypothetical protein